ncbi:MAG: class I SAM-dependent methyltransferase [Acidilobaceae archaeon]|nr:class I SAM-dependent methyltransferase [Acidilobaceae archaeon]MCX8165903.1 class I SAM-dependent methyltransferase [Acidilobaceae archaeon]MDW7974545.1 class I SAM-dependent methyltransferase [Sulfolobales archaeon]
MWETRIPSWLYARLYASWRRVRREVDLIDQVFSRLGARRLLELGCGVGRHGYLLTKRGFSVLLTDTKDWRHGAAKRLPFVEYDLLKGGEVGWQFEGAYAIGVFIVMEYVDIKRAFRNVAELTGGRPFMFDYNFVVHGEPKEVFVRSRGRTYRALLKREEVKEIEGGFRYDYRVEVLDEENRVLGVEDTGYPVYKKERILEALEDAGLEVLETIWASWDREKYMYRFSEKEGDSAFFVVRRATS